MLYLPCNNQYNNEFISIYAAVSDIDTQVLLLSAMISIISIGLVLQYQVDAILYGLSGDKSSAKISLAKRCLYRHLHKSITRQP